ncbi:MAG: hypothetical protein QOG42_1994 [Solirubrobacteraceae bacterium]|jgi:hypothetical protein|nr:hypothetical protein [Solirubrobacteraceae bacterium]
MSSRQEEKEQRRQERLQREAAAQAAAKRKRLVQLIGGVVVACAIVAGVVFALGNGGGGKVDNAGLQGVARAAGCVYRAFPDEGRGHSAAKLTAANYKTNPPTSGTHNPNPAADGLYAPGNEPAIPNWVHTLEHGRVLLQYKPGTDAATVAQLTTLFNENVAGSGGGYHSVLMQNNSKMTAQVAAVAWRHFMTCSEFTPKTIGALRKFRDALIDKGPETVP